MTTLAAVLHEHGIEATDAELAAAAAEGLAWVLTSVGATALPVGEEALLDNAGLRESPGAYAAAATASAGAYSALVATSLTVGEAARLLGVTEGRVRHKIGRGDVYALPSG